MNKRDLTLFGAIIFLLGVLPVVLFGIMNSPEEQLKTFLRKSHADVQEEQAYWFAYRHPEVLRSIPCYCGCARQGHKSNLSCFVAENPKKGRFDTHGLICPMCVQIALGAEILYQKGTPLSEIRNHVDQAFVKYPQLMPTPTPKP